MILDGKSPSGPLAEKWDKRRQELKLVNPANKRKYKILVVGTGLAGASAAAPLGELGYQVEAFCFQDSPEGVTASQPRAASMQQRTIRMTATAYSASSMTRSRAATSGHVRQMCTALQAQQ